MSAILVYVWRIVTDVYAQWSVRRLGTHCAFLVTPTFVGVLHTGKTVKSEDVKEILTLIKNGVTHDEICERFGLLTNTVYPITGLNMLT